MIAVVMAGGRASRMGGAVKPLLRVCGLPLLDHVLRAVGGLARVKVLALTPYTRDALIEYCSRVECIQTPGARYSEDLALLLKALRYRPLLILPADAAYLDPAELEGLAHRSRRVDADIVTMTCGGEPQGISLVKGHGYTWTNIESECKHVNVNTWEDLEEASRRCGYTEETRPQG